MVGCILPKVNRTALRRPEKLKDDIDRWTPMLEGFLETGVVTRSRTI